MNKNYKLISSTFLLALLVGCSFESNSSQNSTSSNSSSSALSSSTAPKKRSFGEMLDDLKTDNITYQSDYLIYYYDLNDEEIIPLKDYDVTAKITDEVYDMVAYEKDMVASYAHLEKDRDGYVISSDINIKNELVSKRVVDGNGESFLWEESVYFNLINYLDAADFRKISDSIYEYNNDLSLPLSIVHTAIPVSTFDIDYFQVNVENNKITSFFYQEIESDKVYENCMYGRRLEISFVDIDNTTIERVKPYEEKEENISLGKALDELRNSSNYSIEAKAYYEDGQVRDLYETYITEKDIIQTQHSDNGDYVFGCHTIDNQLYIFENAKEYLLGEEANGVEVKDLLPTFDFSENVFELVKEEDGYKVYHPFDQMVNVLDYVDVILEHSEEYYAPSGDILFYVKDAHLEKIEFPVFTYTQENAIIAIQQINYSNIGATSISTSTWDNFVLELPKEDVANTWYDESYKTTVKNASKTLTLGEIFDTCIGEENFIPYFIEENMDIDFDAEYSRKDKRVYVEIGFSMDDSTFRDRVKTLFIDNGFELIYSDYLFERFKKNGVIVEFLFNGTDCIAMIDLPIGNILN